MVVTSGGGARGKRAEREDATGVQPERKKSLLFGLLGKAGQEVFDSLPVYVNPPGATAPLSEYQEAVKRLELQYAEECNIMVGRHKFTLRKQEEGETIEEYIACLRVLAQDCEFAEMTDTYIRDQVVFYCHSKQVQERLLSCRNPSLKEVMAIAKAVERFMVSSKELASTSQASNVFYVQDRHKHAPKTPDRAASDRGGGRRSLACFRCGSRDHLADSRTCPALYKSCSKCRKMGHFAAVCKAKKYNTGMKVSSVSESDMDADADIVLSIDDEDGRVKGPIGSVMIGAVELPFTADSGSPLTLISDRTFELKWQDVRLHETDVNPKAFGEHDIVMRGYFWDSLTFRGRTGWRSKDDIVRLKAGQEEIIMRGSRVCGAESTDDVDEWQSHEARDVVTGDEECVNTPPRRGRIGHGSTERCEKAWRGLVDAEGQNGSRPESAKSDCRNVVSSGLEDACAVKVCSPQYITPSRPTRHIRAPKRFEDFVMR
ncbi:hypothetical protein NDU88_005165 [Pleurodeles waltl]|uniref:CCHC-type domain-containing protein n=1 Tax=Pleurodeles waltl TaxID=8319 RepID=A0AAV7VLZ2_PLEWA|nr:hypothetical protein NDU88_005165 [Pleurodeles waltl]